VDRNVNLIGESGAGGGGSSSSRRRRRSDGDDGGCDGLRGNGCGVCTIAALHPPEGLQY